MHAGALYEPPNQKNVRQYDKIILPDGITTRIHLVADIEHGHMDWGARRLTSFNPQDEDNYDVIAHFRDRIISVTGPLSVNDIMIEVCEAVAFEGHEKIYSRYRYPEGTKVTTPLLLDPWPLDDPTRYMDVEEALQMKKWTTGDDVGFFEGLSRSTNASLGYDWIVR